MRWIAVGPVGQPGTNIVLYPPGADPGITDDERRTISEMMAKGTYGIIVLATKDLDGTPSSCRRATPRSSRSPPSSPTAYRTAPSATPPAAWSASTRCTDQVTAQARDRESRKADTLAMLDPRDRHVGRHGVGRGVLTSCPCRWPGWDERIVMLGQASSITAAQPGHPAAGSRWGRPATW